MFAAAKTKFEATEPRDAIEAFVDGANDLAGTFHRFPEAMQQVFHRNVRVLAPFFTGPPPPQITPGDFEAISNQTTLVLGEESRRFWQIAVPAIARRIPSAKLLRLPARGLQQFRGRSSGVSHKDLSRPIQIKDGSPSAVTYSSSWKASHLSAR